MQINGAVSDGTSLTVDNAGSGGSRYAHAIDEPVYRIAYAGIEYSHSATDASSGASCLAVAELQPDDIYTRYEDTTQTTGYGFVRFVNPATPATFACGNGDTFSAYSDGIPYAGQDLKSLAKLRKKVRSLLKELNQEFLDDEEIDQALNEKQKEIAHERLWSFYEIERSFSAVANQHAYDIPSTIKDVYEVSFDTQPLAPINQTRWRELHYDANTSVARPTHFSVFNRQIKLAPRPSTAAATTTLNGDHTAAATTITVAATASFNRGDYYRLIIDSEVIYATASTATTFTGALRGQEGTTAAAHTDTTTVTERDIVYTGQVEPTDLVDVNDETAIPEPNVLAYGAAADLALPINEGLHDRLNVKYVAGLRDLRSKYALKQMTQFPVVKPRRPVGDSTAPIIVGRSNQFPRDVG